MQAKVIGLSVVAFIFGMITGQTFFSHGTEFCYRTPSFTNPNETAIESQPETLLNQSTPSPVAKGSPMCFHPITTVGGCKSSGEKKIFRIFIVTYKNTDRLCRLIENLMASDLLNYTFELFVINNFGSLQLPEEHKNFVTCVMENWVRPDFSTGHLAKDWNTALIHGFRDLMDPVSEIVVTLQGDTIVDPSFATTLFKLHRKGYMFIQSGIGDVVMSYTAEAVRTIGIWDERFCNIGFQDEDYFLRAALYGGTRISLNDRQHGRVVNPIPNSICIQPDHDRGAMRNDPEHARASQYHKVSEQFFHIKYPGLKANFWKTPPIVFASQTPTYYTYPYFEKGIINATEKGYPSNLN